MLLTPEQFEKLVIANSCHLISEENLQEAIRVHAAIFESPIFQMWVDANMDRASREFALLPTPGLRALMAKCMFSALWLGTKAAEIDLSSEGFKVQ